MYIIIIKIYFKHSYIYCFIVTSYRVQYYFKVSDFIGTFQTQEEEKYHLQVMKFFPEINQVVGEELSTFHYPITYRNLYVLIIFAESHIIYI